jgi:glycosyltransferase involved in cell wall biosynthesis
MKKIIVFIPAYNAEKTIVSVLERFPKSTIKRVSEILMLDNNSRDHTFEIAMKYKKSKNLKKLTILKNKANLGYGGSKKRAFKYAIEKGYDIFIMVHSDGQYPPEKIPDMVRPVEDGKADLVIGSRTNAIQGGMKLWKLLGNRSLTFMENIVFGLNLHELHSGYKVYNLHALKKISIDGLNDDHIISSETIALFKLKKFRIKEILIPTFYSKDVTECSFNTSFKYGIDVVKLVINYVLYKLGINLDKKLFT